MKALEIVLNRSELTKMITHLAFYAEWLAASTAFWIAQRAFDEKGLKTQRIYFVKYLALILSSFIGLTGL